MGNKSLSMWAGFECLLSVLGLGYLIYLYEKGLWLVNEPVSFAVLVVIFIRAIITFRVWWCNVFK